MRQLESKKKGREETMERKKVERKRNKGEEGGGG